MNQSVNVDYAIPGRFCGPCWKTKCVARSNVFIEPDKPDPLMSSARNGGKLAREAGLAKKPEVFNLLPKASIVAYRERAHMTFCPPNARSQSLSQSIRSTRSRLWIKRRVTLSTSPSS